MQSSSLENTFFMTLKNINTELDEIYEGEKQGSEQKTIDEHKFSITNQIEFYYNNLRKNNLKTFDLALEEQIILYYRNVTRWSLKTAENTPNLTSHEKYINAILTAKPDLDCMNRYFDIFSTQVKASKKTEWIRKLEKFKAATANFQRRIASLNVVEDKLTEKTSNQSVPMSISRKTEQFIVPMDTKTEKPAPVFNQSNNSTHQVQVSLQQSQQTTSKNKTKKPDPIFRTEYRGSGKKKSEPTQENTLISPSQDFQASRKRKREENHDKEVTVGVTTSQSNPQLDFAMTLALMSDNLAIGVPNNTDDFTPTTMAP